MKATKITKEIQKTYREKGLNSIYAFLKRNGINYKVAVVEFGLQTNSLAVREKSQWMENKDLRFHYYSLGIKSRKTGFSYNRIRGIEIILL